MILDETLVTITITLFVVAILLNVTLQRREGSSVFHHRSVITSSYALFFSSVSILFLLVLVAISVLVMHFPEFAPIWILLSIFCCFVAVLGSFLITNVGDKDLHALYKKSPKISLEVKHPQKISFPFSIVAVDVGEALTSAGKVSNAVKMKLYDQVSTLLQMGLIIFITFYWFLLAKEFNLFILAVGILLLIGFTSFDVQRVQISFGEERYAEVFLSTLLLGICYCFLDLVGLFTLINGIRASFALIKKIRSQELSVNSLYVNLGSFTYFYLLFIYLFFFFRPSLGTMDLLIGTLLPGLVPMLGVMFVYWIIVGRYITSRRFEFIGKRSAIVLGIVTSAYFGLGIPLVIIGLIKYFEGPLNAFFNRWRQNPEQVAEQFKISDGTPRSTKKGQPSSPATQTPPKTPPSKLKKSLFKLKIPNILKLGRGKKSDKNQEKLIRKPSNLEEKTATVSMLKTYKHDLIQILPRNTHDPLLDKVKFGVYANEVKELQLQLNDLTSKPSQDPSKTNLDFIGQLPESFKGQKIFVSPFFFGELLLKKAILGSNVAITLVTPELPPGNTTLDDLLNQFVSKNEKQISVNFINPSEFDLQLYRRILQQFQPTEDVFHVAETVAYANALKIANILVPNLDWLFVADLIKSGRIPAQNISKEIHIILPAQDALPASVETQVPITALSPSVVAKVFAERETPSYVSTRLTYIVTMTVFVLLMFAGIYFLFEQVRIAPVVYLSLLSPFTADETAIIFILWLGAILFLAQYLFIKLSNLRLRGVK